MIFTVESHAQYWIDQYIDQNRRSAANAGASNGSSNNISASNVINAALAQSQQGSSGAINNQKDIEAIATYHSLNSPSGPEQLDETTSGAPPAGSAGGAAGSTSSKTSVGLSSKQKKDNAGVARSNQTQIGGQTTKRGTQVPDNGSQQSIKI